jgi:MAE_28990/MAE_18760-like HEPN
MSKIRSIDDLSRRLYDDFTWRREELSNLKNLIDTKTFSSAKHNALLRSGLTILYAHWEGYIKDAGTCYLEFVSRKQLLYCELKTNFVAIAMKDKLKDAQESNKATIFAEAAEFILHRSSERSDIPYRGIVSTASNLSSTILREIICILGLDYSFFELKENLIDEKLLNRRNIIAHGEYLSLDREEYFELHEQVLLMMEEFRTQIENNAVSASYRR